MTEGISAFIESDQVKTFMRVAICTYGAASAMMIISLLVDLPHMDEWEMCQDTYPGRITDQVLLAKRLGVRFTRG